MQTEHVSFTTTDKLVLPGLLYTPTRPTNRAVVWLHGMGDSGVFYSPKRITALAHALTSQGLALLAFNNRGAHNSKVLHKDDPSLPKSEQHYQAGTHYERIADCVHDIDGAALFLQSIGFTAFDLAGHSTGANKICVYDALRPHNCFRRYVLAGPGDDVGLWYTTLGATKFWRTLGDARTKIATGSPLGTMPLRSGMHPFSAQSAADILDPDGPYNTFPYYEARNGALGSRPLFSALSHITKPILAIAGEYDEATSTAGSAVAALKLLQQHSKRADASSEFQLVADSDHSFHGAETGFATQVASWLVK